MKTRNISKRILAVILSLVMALGMVSTTAFAEPVEPDSVEIQNRIDEYSKKLDIQFIYNRDKTEEEKEFEEPTSDYTIEGHAGETGTFKPTAVYGEDVIADVENVTFDYESTDESVLLLKKSLGEVVINDDNSVDYTLLKTGKATLKVTVTYDVNINDDDENPLAAGVAVVRTLTRTIDVPVIVSPDLAIRFLPPEGDDVEVTKEYGIANYVGETGILEPTLFYLGEKASLGHSCTWEYSSSNNEIVSVNSHTGEWKLNKAGIAYIYVTCYDLYDFDDNTLTIDEPVTVKIKVPVFAFDRQSLDTRTEIRFDKDLTPYAMGEAIFGVDGTTGVLQPSLYLDKFLKIEGTPGGKGGYIQNASFTSSDEDVVLISPSGEYLLKNPGQATIKITITALLDDPATEAHEDKVVKTSVKIPVTVIKSENLKVELTNLPTETVRAAEGDRVIFNPVAYINDEVVLANPKAEYIAYSLNADIASVSPASTLKDTTGMDGVIIAPDGKFGVQCLKAGETQLTFMFRYTDKYGEYHVATQVVDLKIAKEATWKQNVDIATTQDMFMFDVQDMGNVFTYTYDLKAFINTVNALPEEVEYVSDDTSIVTVNNNGILRFTGKTGDATVKVSLTTVDKKFVTLYINVYDSKELNIKVDDKATVDEMAIGDFQDLKDNVILYRDVNFFTQEPVALEYTDGDITWKSSNPAVATVNKGMVEAVGEGKTIITAETADNHFVTFEVKVNGDPSIEATVPSIVVDLKNKDLESYVVSLGEFVKLANASYADVKYFLSSNDILSIDETGNMKFNGSTGIVLAKAALAEDNFVQILVSVVNTQNLEALQIEKIAELPSAQYAVGQTQDIKALINLFRNTKDNTVPYTADEVTWESSDLEVAWVENGVITAVGEGAAIITAYTEDGYFVTFEIEVKGDSEVAIAPIINVDLKDKDTALFNIDAKELVKVHNIDIASLQFSAADNYVLDITADGIITFTGKTGASVIKVAVDDEEFAQALVVVTDSTNAEPLQIKKNGSDILYLNIGDIQTLRDKVTLFRNTEDNVVDYTGSEVTWVSNNEDVVTIVNGSLTAVGGGVATVTAFTEDGYYVTFEVSVKADPALVFINKPNLTPIVMGTSISIAKSLYPSYANVTYTVLVDGKDAVEGVDYLLNDEADLVQFIPLVAGNFFVKAVATVPAQVILLGTPGTELVAEDSFSVQSLQKVTGLEFTEKKVTVGINQGLDLRAPGLLQWNGGSSFPVDSSIKWVVVNTDVADIIPGSDGVIKGKSAGVTQVVAVYNEQYRDTINVYVGTEPTDIAFAEAEYTAWVGEPVNIIANILPKDAVYESAKFTVVDSAIAHFDKEIFDETATSQLNTLLTADKAGKTQIQVALTYKNYDNKDTTIYATANLSVKQPVTSVEVTEQGTGATEVYGYVIGETRQLLGKALPNDAADRSLVWSTDDDSVCTVDQKGKITFTGYGTTYVYATASNGEFGSILVDVGPAVTMNLTPEKVCVLPGAVFQLEAKLSDNQAVTSEVKYTVEGEGVTVDANGLVIVDADAKDGKVVIKAEMQVGNNKYSDFAIVYIGTDVQSIEFKEDGSVKGSLEMYVNEDYDIQSLVVFNDGVTDPDLKDITWEVEGEDPIVAIDAYGKMHALHTGSAFVHAYAYNGLRADIFVTVKSAPTDVNVKVRDYVGTVKYNDKLIIMYAGDRVGVDAVLAPEGVTEKAVYWDSTNSAVAYYDPYLKSIVGAGYGSCFITLTCEDEHFGVITNKIQVNVHTQVTGVVMDTPAIVKEVGQTADVKAHVVPVTADRQDLVFTSSNPAVAVVDEMGLVTCLAPGKAVITAISHNGFVANCNLTVNGTIVPVMNAHINGNGVFVRDIPSLSGKQLTQFNKGKKVCTYGTVGEWTRISYNGTFAYVRTTYVTTDATPNPRNAVVNASALTVYSNAVVKTGANIYEGKGTGKSTFAPAGTRVLLQAKDGNYYKISYGSADKTGTGYIAISAVTKDAGCTYGKATKVQYVSTAGTITRTYSTVSSTPQVTLYKTAVTKTRVFLYESPINETKYRFGIMDRNAKVVLNSQLVNGFYQLIFTNGKIAYVKASDLNMLSTTVKSNFTYNTYTGL